MSAAFLACHPERSGAALYEVEGSRHGSGKQSLLKKVGFSFAPRDPSTPLRYARDESASGGGE